MLDSIFAGATVVVAIGLLIFVHELGHFLVAKKVGIRVEAFSLGFGPKVFGFVRGGTLYKLSAIPLGGYVKMAGELPTDDARGEPDEFSSKSIGQRSWVVSAGVIMNVLFAMILFPLAFVCGVPYSAPIVGNTIPTGPAWHADIRPGDEVLSINGSDVLGFEDIFMELAFADANTETVVRLRRNGETIDRRVIPKYDKGSGFNQIGVLGGNEPFRLKDDAFAKKIGIGPNDEILSINGRPTFSMSDIGDPFGSYSEFYRDLESPLVFDVRRAGSQTTEKVTVAPEIGEIPEVSRFMIGVDATSGRIIEIAASQRESGPVRALGLMKDDIIVRVGDRPVLTSKEILKAFDATPVGPGFTVTVLRKTEKDEVKELTLGPIAFDASSGTALRCALAFGASERGVFVHPGSPAAKAGLISGDKVVAVNDRPIGANDLTALAKAVSESDGKPVRIAIERDGKTQSFDVTPEKARFNRALMSVAPLRPARVTVHAPFPKSVTRGFKEVGYQFEKILAFFRSVFTGRVAAKNVGGIILIAKTSYDIAHEGLGKLLFFMGVLSLNLAFLNILPIPVLDGGHLLFLIIEKIKGGRVPEKFMNICYWIGFLLIIGLMIFVTVNDVIRLAK